MCKYSSLKYVTFRQSTYLGNPGTDAYLTALELNVPDNLVLALISFQIHFVKKPTHYTRYLVYVTFSCSVIEILITP